MNVRKAKKPTSPIVLRGLIGLPVPSSFDGGAFFAFIPDAPLIVKFAPLRRGISDDKGFGPALALGPLRPMYLKDVGPGRVFTAFKKRAYLLMEVEPGEEGNLVAQLENVDSITNVDFVHGGFDIVCVLEGEYKQATKPSP